MAHHRKAVAAAAALNSGIFVVEAVAGYQAGSLALLMDSIHNLSDEMALVFLYLAFIRRLGRPAKDEAEHFYQCEECGGWVARAHSSCRTTQSRPQRL
jgi:Co/Zn/Cd efflux system component